MKTKAQFVVKSVQGWRAWREVQDLKHLPKLDPDTNTGYGPTAAPSMSLSKNNIQGFKRAFRKASGGRANKKRRIT